MSRLTTLQKAKKILNSYDQIQPRKYCINPQSRSNSKHKPQPHKSPSISKSNITLKRDFSFSKSNRKPAKRQQEEQSQAQNSSCLRQRKNSNQSFTSFYNKQTRYDRIMKLKVKPQYRECRRDEKNKREVLSHSRSSCGSRQGSRDNRSKSKQNRLERIMQIKVNKPQVQSTLIQYEPRQGSRPKEIQNRQSAVKEWKACRTKVRKLKEQEDKEDRLWRVFERERGLRLKLKNSADERMYKQKRRKEKRFESIVSKEVSKIEKGREMARRKSQGFSNYIYPL